MGSVIPLKKSANSAYLDLKNLLDGKLESVEKLIKNSMDKSSKFFCLLGFYE